MNSKVLLLFLVLSGAITAQYLSPCPLMKIRLTQCLQRKCETKNKPMTNLKDDQKAPKKDQKDLFFKDNSKANSEQKNSSANDKYAKKFNTIATCLKNPVISFFMITPYICLAILGLYMGVKYMKKSGISCPDCRKYKLKKSMFNNKGQKITISKPLNINRSQNEVEFTEITLGNENYTGSNPEDVDRIETAPAPQELKENASAKKINPENIFKKCRISNLSKSKIVQNTPEESVKKNDA